jgi:uncharacterized DUF497 family protein
MDLTVDGFDWDQGNWPKCGKHGVPCADIEALFESRPAIYPDPGHSRSEERMLAIGQSGMGRFVLVAFTLRRSGHETLIRPISARYMHKREVEHYERQRQAQAATPPEHR